MFSRQLRFQELDLCPASLAVQNPELGCCCGSSDDSLATLVLKAFPQPFKGPVGVPPCFRAYILSLTRYAPYILEGFLGVSTASKIALLHSSVILSWQQIKVGQVRLCPRLRSCQWACCHEHTVQKDFTLEWIQIDDLPCPERLHKASPRKLCDPASLKGRGSKR